MNIKGNMHFWVSTAIVTLYVFEVSSVYGSLTVSYNGSNEVGSTTYSLICDIPGFSTQAVWSKAGKSMSVCLISGCLVTSTPPYTFRISTSAIYVDFSVLTENETGIQWTCSHIGDTSVNFKVQVDLTPESDKEGLLVDPKDDKGGLSGGVKAGISVGAIAGISLVLIVVLLVIRRKTKRFQDDENKLSDNEDVNEDEKNENKHVLNHEEPNPGKRNNGYTEFQ
ncbi:cell adhesion molecule CEACAM1-like [Mytilus edulis]|uniref:cell adhesion molecule CEACAM1-like n=1 Tax=Mytilus edulis TaxID=6550 RepID=UPI0039F0D62E